MRCEELQLELSATLRARGANTGTTWSTTHAPASEIERIMAKIEQDNRILAELEHTRSTTHGKIYKNLKTPSSLIAMIAFVQYVYGA